MADSTIKIPKLDITKLKIKIPDKFGIKRSRGYESDIDESLDKTPIKCGYDSEDDTWRCVLCGDDMGKNNPRQLCCKTYCPSQWKTEDSNKKPRKEYIYEPTQLKIDTEKDLYDFIDMIPNIKEHTISFDYLSKK